MQNFTLPSLLVGLVYLVFLLGAAWAAKHRLNKENSDRTMMVALLSHRLRTPLTSIKWYLEMLLDNDYGKLQIAQIELVNHLNMSVNDAISILNTFLESSRVERGIIGSKTLSIDVADTLRTVVASVATLASDKKQTIKVDTEQNRMVALLNPFVLNMLLEVLLHNAITYTPNGGTITVTAKEEGKNIMVSVQDTGIGMTKEELSHLFTKFYRGKQAMEVDTTGNGLGLYLVKDVLKQIGGSVRVTSEPGKGSCFIIEMPNAQTKS